MNDKPKSVSFGTENLQGLVAGLNQLADAVKETLGPRGRNVIIERGYGSPSVTKDGVSVAKEIDLVDPIQNMGAQMAKDVAAKTCDEAGDGPQPLYSKVATPRGFVTMGSLRVGDTVCGTNNTIQEVLAVYPKGEKEVVLVSFADGRVAECCEDHVWDVTTHYGSRKIITTREMLEKGAFTENDNGDKRYHFYTPRTSVDFQGAEPILDPYLLGVLLGDGSISSKSPGDASIEISLGAAKEHILPKLVLPSGFTLSTKWVDAKNYYRVKIKGVSDKGDSFHDLLQKVGILGMTSHTKGIPVEYLFSSVESRNQLLQGLVDTDGYRNSRGLFEFSTVSDKLKEDFSHLCWSLGISLNYRLHTRENDASSYADAPIHRFVELKGYKYGDKITGIERTGRMTPMQCIKVSNPDSLYLTDGFIVTHNTTTATVLAQAIANEGLRVVANGGSPVELKRGMDRAVDVLCAELDNITVPVDGDKEKIARVGTISANNERAVGDLLADAIEAVGRDGVITIEESDREGMSLEMVEGMELSEGMLSKAFITEQNATELVFHDPVFFLVNKEISTINEILPGINSILKAGAAPPVVVVCKGITQPALFQFLKNVAKGVIRAVVVRAPGFKEQQDNMLMDLAVATGSKLYSDTNTPLAQADIKDMGQAARVVISGNKTIIEAPRGDADVVLARIDALRASMEGMRSEYEKEKVLDRIAKLSGAIAVIRVGGRSEVEVKELRDRVEDAMHATRAAVESGVVPGGGVALLLAREAARGNLSLKELPEEQRLGVELVFRAVESPIYNILKNAGVRSDRESPEVIISNIRKGLQPGYNAHTDQYEDLMVTGVIDPVKVTKTALRNAVSIAGMMLTTSCSIVYDRKNQPAASLQDFM